MLHYRRKWRKTMTELQNRRKILAEQLPPKSVAILTNPPESLRTADEYYLYRPNSNMLYLTGIEEPAAVALILSNDYDQQFIAFVKQKDPEMEKWTGPTIGPENAVKTLGADLAFPLTDLNAQLEKYLFSTENLYFDFRLSQHIYPIIHETIMKLRHRGRKAAEGPRNLSDLFDLVAEMRKIKSPEELKTLRIAADIAVQAFKNARNALKPDLWEYEIQAVIEASFRKLGAMGPSFKTIVAGSHRATTLHYSDNNCKLNNGDLLLIDAGAEYRYYASDISRTYPVAGKFTSPQAEIYDIVLTAQKNAINAAIPGNNIKSPHDEVRKTYAHALSELGIIKKSPEEIYDNNLELRYYMHGTSHFLGMDTHDVGIAYHRGNDKPEILAPGMLITVEPGLYFPIDDPDVPQQYRGIGIRIEDDILITQDANENLTRNLPKEINEIEN